MRFFTSRVGDGDWGIIVKIQCMHRIGIWQEPLKTLCENAWDFDGFGNTLKKITGTNYSTKKPQLRHGKDLLGVNSFA